MRGNSVQATVIRRRRQGQEDNRAAIFGHARGTFFAAQGIDNAEDLPALRQPAPGADFTNGKNIDKYVRQFLWLALNSHRFDSGF
jgi:hypothetical protein